jgi:hypothetical protein
MSILTASTSQTQASNTSDIRAFNADIAEALGIQAAVIIQQLHYWSEKQMGVVVDGKQYIYNTYKDWVSKQFTWLSAYQIRTWMNKLRSLGIVEVIQYRKKEYNRTNYYSLNYSKLYNYLGWAKNARSTETVELCKPTHRDVKSALIDVCDPAPSYTKSTSIEKLRKENINTDPFLSKEKDSDIASPESSHLNMLINIAAIPENDSSVGINVPQVDEKINKKKEMKSDRYFGQANQQEQIRKRAKMDSAVGMSGFKDVEDLRRCQKELTLYFAKQLEPQKAAEKASWMIKAERQGERSPYVQDYLDGVAIGSWCKKEWEIEPGIIFPVFRGYLLNKLRRGEDTREQVNVKISWFLKDLKATEDAWAECKRLVDVEQPRLIQAIERGQDLSSANIPHWIIDAYRPEIPIEQVSATAEVLSSAAIAYNKKVKRHQDSLAPKLEDIPELPEDSPVRALLEKYNFQPENDLEQRGKVDSVMDEVALSADDTEEEEMAKVPTERINEIDLLLKDPITRARGIYLAKAQNLSLLLNNDGVAIGIDRSDRADKHLVQEEETRAENSQAYQLYQPEQIEKATDSAWEEMIAKSPFLSKIRRSPK